MSPSDVFDNLVREVRLCSRNPARIRLLLQREKRALLGRRLLTSRSERSLAAPWSSSGVRGVARRKYVSYEHYVRHQASKLATLDLTEYERTFHTALTQRVRELAVPPGSSVICLGARLGTEVRVFKDLGHFAVGVDLNPGSDNLHVLPGDFHHLQFPDSSCDVVFSNSLDHALELAQVLSEAVRVLKPQGLLVLELMAGSLDGSVSGFFESTFWERCTDVVETPEISAFTQERKLQFELPWNGWHFELRADNASSNPLEADFRPPESADEPVMNQAVEAVQHQHP